MARVPVRTGTTLATRIGAWPEYLIAALALAGFATALLDMRRSRRRGTDDESPATPAREEMVGA